MHEALRTEAACHGCKKDREKRDEQPRPLYELPADITNTSQFRRKTLPVYLCLHCDGDNLEDAVREHQRRTNS